MSLPTAIPSVIDSKAWKKLSYKKGKDIETGLAALEKALKAAQNGQHLETLDECTETLLTAARKLASDRTLPSNVFTHAQALTEWLPKLSLAISTAMKESAQEIRESQAKIQAFLEFRAAAASAMEAEAERAKKLKGVMQGKAALFEKGMSGLLDKATRETLSLNEVEALVAALKPKLQEIQNIASRYEADIGKKTAQQNTIQRSDSTALAQCGLTSGTPEAQTAIKLDSSKGHWKTMDLAARQAIDVANRMSALAEDLSMRFEQTCAKVKAQMELFSDNVEHATKALNTCMAGIRAIRTKIDTVLKKTVDNPNKLNDLKKSIQEKITGYQKMPANEYLNLVRDALKTEIGTVKLMEDNIAVFQKSFASIQALHTKALSNLGNTAVVRTRCADLLKELRDTHDSVCSELQAAIQYGEPAVEERKKHINFLKTYKPGKK